MSNEDNFFAAITLSFSVARRESGTFHAWRYGSSSQGAGPGERNLQSREKSSNRRRPNESSEAGWQHHGRSLPLAEFHRARPQAPGAGRNRCRGLVLFVTTKIHLDPRVSNPRPDRPRPARTATRSLDLGEIGYGDIHRSSGGKDPLRHFRQTD